MGYDWSTSLPISVRNPVAESWPLAQIMAIIYVFLPESPCKSLSVTTLQDPVTA